MPTFVWWVAQQPSFRTMCFNISQHFPHSTTRKRTISYHKTLLEKPTGSSGMLSKTYNFMIPNNCEMWNFMGSHPGNHYSIAGQNYIYTLVLQDPSESVFWAGFKGLDTSWKGIWSTRDKPSFQLVSPWTNLNSCSSLGKLQSKEVNLSAGRYVSEYCCRCKNPASTNQSHGRSW